MVGLVELVVSCWRRGCVKRGGTFREQIVISDEGSESDENLVKAW